MSSRTERPVLRTPFMTRAALAAATLSIPFLLTACAPAADDQPTPPAVGGASSQPDDPAPAADAPAPAPAGAGQATLVIGPETWDFELAFCIIDDTDVIAHGPGTDASGADAYLGVDFVRTGDDTDGAARVDVGATGQFQSSDEFYALDMAYLVGDYTLTIEGARFFLDGAFHQADGQSVGSGSLSLDCS